MRIIHVAAGLWEDTGGPSEVIPKLCLAQSRAGASVTLCLIDGNNAESVKELMNTEVEVKIFPALESWLRFSPQMFKYLASQRKIDIIHNHGHWLWPNWISLWFSLRLKACLVTTPHGALGPNTLRVSRLKKFFSWIIFDRKLIEKANIVHALSDAEKEGMKKKIGNNINKVIVIPNGVDLPIKSQKIVKNRTKTLLFLSRVTQIKGVLELLKAWMIVYKKFPDWELKIVGPIDPSIKNEINSYSIECESIIIYGPVYNSKRWELYENSSAFILPTFGEGLPTVLLEAAAYSLPIVTTLESNFDDLLNSRGCIITKTKAKEIEKSLLKLMSLSSRELIEMGSYSNTIVKNKYLWSSIASNWLSLYEDHIN